MIESVTYTTRPGQPSSSGYIEVYAPNGAFVSRHRNAEEATESALAYAQENSVGGAYEFRYPNKVVQVRLSVAAGDNTPPSGSSSYTATHYVDVAANVGAANDYTDQGASAWAAATTPETAVTIETAMVRASGSNKVQVASGVYTYPTPVSSTSWGDGATFIYPRNDGTSAADPLVFFAEVPAATNPESGSLSRFTNGATTPSASNAVFGFRGDQASQYVVFDGFYVDQAQGAYPSSGSGQCVIRMATQCEIRRCLFDRTDLPGTDNYAAIRWGSGGTGTGNKVRDCLFRGGTSYIDGVQNASHNDAAINTYWARDIEIEQCRFQASATHNIGCGVFIKGTESATTNGSSGSIHHCWFEGGEPGGYALLDVNAADAGDGGVDIYQNVIYGGSPSGFAMDDSLGNEKTVNFYNNTVVDTTGSIGDVAGVVRSKDIGTNISQVSFHDNIIAHMANTSTSFVLVNIHGSLTEFGDVGQWDYNYYYMAETGVERFFSSASSPLTDDTLEDWQSAWSGAGIDANSQSGADPFEDYATQDFRIASGHAALTMSSASSVGGAGAAVGAYVTGAEEIGIRANPTY